jgi:hypothetical protein
MSIETEYKQFISHMTTDEISSFGDDYTSCWLFAYFIHKKYDLPVDQYDPVYTDECKSVELNRNGIYSFCIDSDEEVHHFIILVNDERAVLMCTYGGQSGIIKKEYIAKKLACDINKILSSKNSQLYKSTFDIQGNISVTNVSLSVVFKSC